MSPGDFPKPDTRRGQHETSMAFLVCYSNDPPRDHTRNKAAYLDQRFYELIFAHCRSADGPYRVLRDIASLRYKSPTMVVRDERLAVLVQDLAIFAASGLSHDQTAEFRQVCLQAQVEQCALTISGDMYPEL